MQADKFVEWIGHPDLLNHGSEEKLRQLAQKFPYSQPVRVLLAKNLQQLRRPDFETHVNQAAACATDRRKFQRFMSGRSKSHSTTNSLASPKNKTAKKKNRSFFSTWILQLFFKSKNPALTVKMAEAPVNNSANTDKADKSPINATQAETTHPTPIKAGSKHDAIIERFIREEPRIKPRADNITHENLAAKNQLDPQDIGTETLASILLKQGQPQKALDIYQKLSLKFPEKNSYFAEKINSIKNEINLKK